MPNQLAHPPRSQLQPPGAQTSRRQKPSTRNFNIHPEFRYPGSPKQIQPSNRQVESHESTEEELRGIDNYFNKLAAQSNVETEQIEAKKPAPTSIRKQDVELLDVAADVVPGPPNSQAVIPTALRLVITDLSITVFNTPVSIQAYVLTSSVNIIGHVATYNGTVPVTVPSPSLTPNTTIITTNGVVTPSVAFIVAGAMRVSPGQKIPPGWDEKDYYDCWPDCNTGREDDVFIEAYEDWGAGG